MIYILLLALPFLLSLVITPSVRTLVQKNGVLDMPSERKVHTIPTPLLGGLAIFCSFWVSLFSALLVPSIRRELMGHLASLTGLMVGSLIIIGTGTYDDCRHIRPAAKLFFQGLASSIIIAFGFQIRMVSNLFSHGPFPLGWASIPVTFLWVIGITNAVNIIDGLDGLASGVAVIAGLAIFTIAYLNHNAMSAFLSLILAGSVLGFLVYNFNPASIFLGDSGSLFLGFWLSYLSVRGVKTSPNSTLPMTIPLLILALPIMDTLLAMSRRFFQPKPRITLTAKLYSMFKADQDHIHHKLLRRGWSHRLAVLILYALCLLFSGCAVSTQVWPWVNERALGLLLLICCLSVKTIPECKIIGRSKSIQPPFPPDQTHDTLQGEGNPGDREWEKWETVFYHLPGMSVSHKEFEQKT